MPELSGHQCLFSKDKAWIANQFPFFHPSCLCVGLTSISFSKMTYSFSIQKMLPSKSEGDLLSSLPVGSFKCGIFCKRKNKNRKTHTVKYFHICLVRVCLKEVLLCCMPFLFSETLVFDTVNVYKNQILMLYIVRAFQNYYFVVIFHIVQLSLVLALTSLSWCC